MGYLGQVVRDAQPRRRATPAFPGARAAGVVAEPLVSARLMETEAEGSPPSWENDTGAVARVAPDPLEPDSEQGSAAEPVRKDKKDNLVRPPMPHFRAAGPDGAQGPSLATGAARNSFVRHAETAQRATEQAPSASGVPGQLSQSPVAPGHAVPRWPGSPDAQTDAEYRAYRRPQHADRDLFSDQPVSELASVARFAGDPPVDPERVADPQAALLPAAITPEIRSPVDASSSRPVPSVSAAQIPAEAPEVRIGHVEIVVQDPAPAQPRPGRTRSSAPISPSRFHVRSV